MDKMKFETLDMTAENVEKITELFPNCVTEMRDESGKVKRGINFEVLKQMISSDVVDGDECYEFTWVGKKASIAEANKPIRKTLRPCPEESKDWDTTENLYIEGDNLEVLKLLQESYLGKVKMIYIDPPYNTGNDFIYADDFMRSQQEENEQMGMYDEDDNRLFQNTDTNGRFHSDWCSMMYSRLMLARNLLSEDGVIFISIDDGEVENLKKMCDEVFGADNYINIISLKLKNIAGASGGGEDKRLKKNMEFILLYAKSYKAISQFNNVYSYTPISELVEQYRQEGVSWKYITALTDPGGKVYVGSTVDGDGSEIKIFKRVNYAMKSIGQIIKEEGISEKKAYEKYASCIFQTAMPQSSIRPRVMQKVREIGMESDLYSIEYVPKTGRNKGTVYEQFYKGENFRLFAWMRDVAEEKDGVLYKKDLQGTLWDFVGETKNLTKEGDVPFPNGKKPVKLIQQMLKMITQDKDIILDFFSGSATTAHAVMQLNAEDGGHRKFIMVQLPEPCDEQSEAYKAGYKNICEIGKERIRRAGEKIKAENSRIDIYVSAIDEIVKDKSIKMSIKSYVHEVKEKWIEDENDPEVQEDVVKQNIIDLINENDTLFDEHSTYEQGGDRLSDLVIRLAQEVSGLTYGIDIGFRVLKLADSNMKDVYYAADDYKQADLLDMVSNIKDDRTDLDLLFGCLIDWGLPLSMPYTSEQIEGCTVHTYNDGDLIACFDANIPESVVKEIASRKPLRTVFRDSSFANSPAKINVFEIFKLYMPEDADDISKRVRVI